jgi:alkylation response protein AidB-like acyl-CoA dehydrogenase
MAEIRIAPTEEHWLPGLIRGEQIGALAMTEPSGGSGLQRIRTVTLPGGDGLRLNGQKTFVSNGQHTNLTMVAATTDQADGAWACRCSRSKANARASGPQPRGYWVSEVGRATAGHGPFIEILIAAMWPPSRSDTVSTLHGVQHRDQ